ncbi:pigment-dispersing hormone peptides isoform X1 [Harpegnathos saltator]|uniref:pigment-dispersing hormone peptides isoform X1 n=1 Tax=Harpegnathos saltator TaxID=610380 RepID=UPI00058FF4CD|nr:pigment-dispersing hormone peptides isoform X1 [Harpegnathos saltator]
MHTTIVRCIERIRLHIDDTLQVNICVITTAIRPRYFILHEQHLPMANYARCGVAVVIVLGLFCGQVFGELEDADRNVQDMSIRFGRGLDSELQLARLLLVAPRFCHPKRNSEIINSLLGLPKNMHNAGK